jgi:hypothetical protein
LGPEYCLDLLKKKKEKFRAHRQIRISKTRFVILSVRSHLISDRTSFHHRDLNYIIGNTQGTMPLRFWVSDQIYIRSDIYPSLGPSLQPYLGRIIHSVGALSQRPPYRKKKSQRSMKITKTMGIQCYYFLYFLHRISIVSVIISDRRNVLSMSGIHDLVALATN